MASLTSLKERLLSRIEKHAETGCWNWTGSRVTNGYGQIWFGAKMLRAHRASYQVHCGDIADGLFVCHKCDNRSCINPDHLFLGTHDDNVKDMLQKNRQSRVQGAQHGHSKLTEVDIKAIRDASGITQRELAERYNVSRYHIRDIQLGKRWGHISNERQKRRRLTKSEIQEIRASTGISSRLLASKFGVSHPTILSAKRS